MKYIKLTNGGFAICSEEDFAKLSSNEWFRMKDGNQTYAARSGSKNGSLIRMHAEVFGAPGPDHKNGNGLDNRRENLRAATAVQNQMNRGKYAHASSPYKGVTWLRQDKKWWARIKVEGKRLDLGRFPDERSAALAYNEAAIKHFGEFARINDMDKIEQERASKEALRGYERP